ncbi:MULTISPECIES: cytochrome c oxidase assembly protein [Amycolatopsis]|uniref:cytochrome c oxidase assembly protein n=1 Tax=Amycolatopsis TaxID=1813 RepID=UPI00174DD5FD|nr:cytochrome c oxidase assembly protein [Amycolatopsis bullii]
MSVFHHVPALLALAAYETGAWRLRRRGDRWPPIRDAVFGAGVVVALAPGGSTFTAHVLQHVLVGMLAPVLIVLARPVTLLLRAVPAAARRLLKHALRAAGVLVFPPVAAVLEVGSLWLLYRTDLFAKIGDAPWLHLHVFLTGLLFTTAICRLDPLRHRAGLGVRAGALIGAAAAHAVLAKTLYVSPPPGVVLAVADRQAGAQLMYYGGDVVELGLALIVALQWYAARGRAQARSSRRTGVPSTAGS